MEKVNIAIIGLGNRGQFNLKTILNLGGINVTAVCDTYEDRCEEAADIIVKSGGKKPFMCRDYQDAIARSDVDVVMVFAAWEAHVEIAVAAMEAGRTVAMEVGGAYAIEDCYRLVDTYEKTRTPFMFLENCCYGKNEMLVRNIAADGVLGEIVYCHGAYAHDLREEIAYGRENRHYRLNNYLYRNCENYPTHELGPIAKILGINRGNQMVRLVSMASKSAGLNQYINDRRDNFANRNLIGQKFMQGDIVDTLITCANGETISLRLDTTLPRSYSREFTVRGTKGMYEENTNTIFLDGDKEEFDPLIFYKNEFNNAKRFEQQYLPDVWKNITDEIIESGHGGMDYFLFQSFFDRVRKQEAMPIDVYDAAAWMCISCLSAQSIAGGNVPVEIPDFTKGAWKNRPRFDV